MSYRIYYFETLEVYQTANQFARVLGAIGASLGRRRKRKVTRLIEACIELGTSIAGGNAEMPPEEDLTREERQAFLQRARESTAFLRAGLQQFRKEQVGSQPHIMAGLELLERIDVGLADNVALIGRGFIPPCRQG
ncbi:MAG: hypothetical protein ACRENP_01425 [Longimicrobiales bacterium]